MQIKIIQDDKSIKTHNLKDTPLFFAEKSSALVFPKTKLESYRELFFCEQNNITAVCFDHSMKNICAKCESLGVTKLEDSSKGVSFNGAKALFFTSGTTAKPRAAIKTYKMIDLEIAAQIEYLRKYKFDSFLVTVPVYHIYGYLFGYCVPKKIGCDLYTKELFMPQNIISFTSENRCVCVTTPVFIKAMLKIDNRQDLSGSLFISSTGALSIGEVEAFYDKFGAKIVQIYGSTETGGVAYLERGKKLWQPLEGVEFSIDKESKLQISSPYLSHQIFEDCIRTLETPFTTSDIVKLEEGGFEILGRSFELLKIGGKRISVLEIEAALEECAKIIEAQVIPIRTDGLKDEKIEILAVCNMNEKELNSLVFKTLKELYLEIKINAKCRKVITLEKTFNGKKKRN